MKTEITYDLVFSFAIKAIDGLDVFQIKNFADKLYELLGKNGYINKNVPFQESGFPGATGLEPEEELELENLSISQ